jgi:nucleoside-diphosphate-sugar epimerase
VNVLVMGGSKFNGRHVVEELRARRHQVAVVNRGVTPATFPADVERLIANREDVGQLRAVLAGREFDALIDVSAFHFVDVERIVGLMEGRIGHYVFLSSVIVVQSGQQHPFYPIDETTPLDVGTRAFPYSKEKQQCEAFLLDAWAKRRFPVSIGRLAMVYGPHNKGAAREQVMFLRLLRGRPVLIPGNGETISHGVHVDDVAGAAVAMAETDRSLGETYIVAGPDAVTDNGYVRVAGEVVGTEPRVVRIPLELMDEVEWELRRRRLPPLIQRPGQSERPWHEHTIYSVAKLRGQLGYQHKYTFEQGMRQTFEWFTSEGLDRDVEWDFAYEDELLRRLGAPV